MNNNNVIQRFLSVAAIALFVFAGCTKYEDPANIYPTNVSSYKANPAITSIQPGDSAAAGVREISLIGENFSTNILDNQVYFNKSIAKIKSASATKLVVYRPILFGDTVSVKVMTKEALSINTFANNYKINQPIYPFDNVAVRVASFTNKIFSIDIDKNENLYFTSFASQGSVIYKVTPEGVISTFIPNSSLSIVNFPQLYDIKSRTDGLYLATGKRVVWRSIGGAAPAQFASVSKEVSFMDFDQNGNLYGGAKAGIVVIHPDRSFKLTGRYAANFDIKRIRYYNNALYVAAAYTGGDTTISKMAVWKNQIIGSDSLGANELVVDLKNKPEFSSCTISWFDIDAAGVLYLCIKSHPQYSLFVLESDGAITPFYFEGIIPFGVDQLVWGNNKSVYLNRGITVFNTPNGDSTRIYRLGMENNGAPYVGR